MDFASPALLELGRYLRGERYAFTAVTPATHAHAMHGRAETLRDVFGWNLPFAREQFAEAAAFLEDAGALLSEGALVRSAVRFASASDALFLHSGYPTTGNDSVFFGPDTYRFLRALSGRSFGRVVDVGTGSGAAGIICGAHADEVVLADINPAALRAARTNLALNGARAEIVHSDILMGVNGAIDTVIANPPFMADTQGRTYRDGGGAHGTGIARRITEQAIARLSPRGTLLLYSGAPIIQGRDVLATALEPLRDGRVYAWSYEEIDPDIFGEELSEPGYADVERIAAVLLTVTVK